MAETGGPEAAIDVANADRLDWPVVIAVPHAGRAYSDDLLRRLAVPPAQLVKLEDRFADALAGEAAARGIAVACARMPRAHIDLNRSEDDFDRDMIDGAPAMKGQTPSQKVRGGLGLVPRRLHGVGELWRGMMPQAELAARIARQHRPWHALIAELLVARRAAWGGAVLIDLHSMPPIMTRGNKPAARIVIGDLRGRASGGRLAEAALAHARHYGLPAALNDPYPGGHTLERHGRPAANVHALQVEIDRSLYLDATLDRPGEGIAAMTRWVADLAAVLSEEIAPGSALEAAE